VRTLVFVVAIGCGSTTVQPKPTPPEITVDASVTSVDDAAAPVVRGAYSDEGPACMPTGRYKAAWDMGSATIKGGTVECREQAGFVPMQNMGTMSIDVTDGALVVHWPNLLTIVSTAECAFDLTSQGVKGAVVFTDGKGAGVVDFAVGSPNHPEESCDVKGAKVSLERQRW
jgi:hypothetical protein